MPSEKQEKFTSELWADLPEEDDPFVAKQSICAGYDVYGDLLGKVNWIDYLFLLYKKEAPSKQQFDLLNDLSVALASHGPRDISTQAATSAAAGGSHFASCLMAALAVASGQNGGAREVFHAVKTWEKCGLEIDAWNAEIKQEWPKCDIGNWPALEHPPGFEPNGVCLATPVKQLLDLLAKSEERKHLVWLNRNINDLQEAACLPMSMTGVVACGFFELGLDAQQAEMLYLLLRLPGISAFALEQHRLGWDKYPFHKGGIKLENDSE